MYSHSHTVNCLRLSSASQYKLKHITDNCLLLSIWLPLPLGCSATLLSTKAASQVLVHSMSTTVCHCLESEKIQGQRWVFNHNDFAHMIYFPLYMLSCHLQRIFLGSDQVSRRWWIVNGFCQYCSDKCILRGHIRLFVLSTRENFHRMVRSLIWFSSPSEHKGISEVLRIAGLWKM